MTRRTIVSLAPATGGLGHRLGLLLFGALFLAIGGAIMAVALGHLPGRTQAPGWVIASAGGVFAAGGGLIVFEALAVRPAFKAVLQILLIAALAVPFHWVAFGPGERRFNATTSVPGVSQSAPAGETAGRIAFGVGSVLLDLVLAGLVVAALRRPRSAMDTPTVPRRRAAPRG
jgi:hypothetical protein